MVPITYNIRNLIERKTTTLMTALGIALTVAVLVTAVSLTSGLASVFAATGDPRQVIILRKGTSAELSSAVTEDAYQIIRTLPGIDRMKLEGQGNPESSQHLEPMVSQEGLAVVNLPSVENPEGMSVAVRGVLGMGLAMRNLQIVDGRMFTPADREIIVGEGIAKRYPKAKLGSELAFGRGKPWKVVGVFRIGDSAANSEIWTNLDQLRGAFERSGGSSSLLVRLASEANFNDFKKTVEADQRLGVSAIGEKQYYADMTQSGLPLEILGFAVAVIMAVGSAFAATNTMYAAVSRRTREIGTLRALGFGRWSILFSFMAESFFLAMIGGVIGVLLSLPLNGISSGIGNFQTFSDTTFKFKVGFWAIVCGLLFAGFIGGFGGLLPAWAASRKNIIQAMRDI